MKHSTAAFSHFRFWFTIFGFVALVIVLSVRAAHTFDRDRPLPSLPVIGSVKGDLAAVERSGRDVHFSDLRGKVVVCAYLYTVCPHGCAAITAQMQKLNQMYGGRTDLQLLSVAIQPEQDTMALLSAYADAVGAKPESPWWFVTGHREKLWDFMTHELCLEAPKAIPEDQRFTPNDLYQHDLRIVLVDRLGRVRRHYAVFHPQPEIAAVMCQQLQRDVALLLDHPEL